MNQFKSYKNMDLVSILVPIYNVQSFIDRCAHSLFKQTYLNIEYIFVDDASPDDSVNILKSVIRQYPHRSNNIRIIRHQKNKGIAGTRNSALKAASGSYILHVDSDDWLELDAVDSMLKTANKFDADIVYSDFIEVRKSYTNILKNPNIINSEEYTKSLLRRKSLTHVIGKLIRKNIITDNNLWTIEGINQGEDYLITPKIAYFSKIVAKAEKPLYNYNRLNDESYTANVNDNGIDMIIKVQELLVRFFNKIPDSDKFKDTIAQSCIYNKLTCFYCGPYSSYPKISNLYRDIVWHNMKLKYKQKFVLALSDLGLLRLLYFIISNAK